MFECKKRNFFDDFDTDFDSRSDTSDDHNVREFGFVVDQHISDHFDDKTSGDECSVKVAIHLRVFLRKFNV